MSTIIEPAECATAGITVQSVVFWTGDTLPMCHLIGQCSVIFCSSDDHANYFGRLLLRTDTNKCQGQPPPSDYARNLSSFVNRPQDWRWRRVRLSVAGPRAGRIMVKIRELWQSQRVHWRAQSILHQLFSQVRERDWGDDQGTTARRAIKLIIPNKIVESNSGGQLLRGRQNKLTERSTIIVGRYIASGSERAIIILTFKLEIDEIADIYQI